ncbi:hypothetical protein IMG5_114710 [Ichthyophthirius multifiliis]|uniref:Glutamine cyclotransferase n=1 Tax=Ichthyophthirius multifiliis TaxID=5932 RepID=G0QU38_ICHMU|nr:hypothetical protein IMG5_114710 [Ichthyophthirius multifiliis]EGR31262.1 hypothetical protein IMG5_114710 [Ichthyophthirius multifiliis]|eukprot:XP_004034748.1 hypothetical protein IMG5_114710 [Ichthyophthirius multifiliis]
MFLDNNNLLESVGLYNQSSIHYLHFDSNSNQLNQIYNVYNVSEKLNKTYFAEGSVLYNDKIYLLTWLERKVLVFDKLLQKKEDNNIDLPEQIQEGWGIALYQDYFIISDGTEYIYFVDPTNFKFIKKIKVVDKHKKVYKYLNELEIYKGKLLANQYYTNNILVINLETGVVEKLYNLIELSQEIQKDMDDKYYIQNGFVLNGIAYNSQLDILLVTGKKWPKVYQIRLI